MNKIFFYLMTLVYLQAANYNTDWVDKAVEEIKPARKGVDLATLERVINPFLYGVVAEKKIAKKVKPKYQKSANGRSVYFNVTAILNDAAKINNRWIKIGKRLNGYTLSQTAKEYVILKKVGKKPIKVYLNRKNKKIRLKTQ